MEIEIGDYVRTLNGEIHKVVKIKKDLDDMSYYGYENNMGDFSISILKYSKNIIDLIEIGDLIDYYSNCLGTHIKTEVVNVVEEKEDCKWGKGYCTTCIDEHIRISDIKTILTKEQYMNNCYVVEEW